MSNFIGGLSAFLAFIPNPIVSANEAWFLSNTEKVHWLFKKIKEVIDRVNTYEELFEELKDILVDFDDTVREEVEKYIQEMYENGELGDIVEQYVQEYVDDYLETRDFGKMSELALTRVNRDLNEYQNTKSVTDGSSNYLKAAQGGVVYKNGNQLGYMGLYSGTHTGVNYRTYIRNYTNIYDITSRVTSQTQYDFGHGNGVTYDENSGLFYVAGSSRYNALAEYIPDTNIYAFNLSQSEVSQKDLLSFGARDVAWYNGTLYTFYQSGYNIDLYSIDYANEVVTLVKSFTLPNSENIMCLDIANDKVFFCSVTDHKLYVYDLDTANFLWCYNIPYFDYLHCYEVPEIENITVMENGDIYITTYGHETTISEECCAMVQLFKCNYITNAIPDKSEINKLYQIASNPIYVKGVGSYGTIYQPTITNPNGSSSKPFETVNEAVMYVNNHPFIDHAVIHILGNNRFSCFVTSNKGIVLRSDDTSNIIAIGGVGIRNSGQVGLYALSIWNSNPNLTGNSRSPIRCFGSVVTFRDVETHGTSTANYTDVTSGCYIAQATIASAHGSTFVTGTDSDQYKFGMDGSLMFFWTASNAIYLNKKSLITDVGN